MRGGSFTLESAVKIRLLFRHGGERQFAELRMHPEAWQGIRPLVRVARDSPPVVNFPCRWSPDLEESF
jgi:hypothetical protein